MYIPCTSHQTEKFVLPALGHGNLPLMQIGDYNNHSTTWGYTSTDDNGEVVEKRADLCNLTLIHTAKLSKSFNGARWKRGYNPDLIFVTESIANMCGKSVMKPIPHTQHLPICERANPVVVAHPTSFRRCFKLRKADWNGYSTELDKLIENVEPIPENYGGFVDNVRVASRRYIPREYRTNHIPGLSEESKSLYEEYKKQYASDPFDNGTTETGNTLMNNMKEVKKKRWEEVITSTNMTHNSRKAWKIIKNRSNDPTSPIAPCLVSAKQVYRQLLINSRGTMSNKPKRPVLSPTAEQSMVYPFSDSEYILNGTINAN